jgi:phosphoserine phosphatase RsbU/P
MLLTGPAARQEFTILVVDDNRVNVRILEQALIKTGYHVLSAAEGSTARELAARGQPDLILLDIMMPGEDGFEVIKQLKNGSSTAHIPTIFLTSRNELDAKMNGFELGAVDYITKPFHVQEVLARVRLHLRLSVATNSLIKHQAEKLGQIREAQSAMLVEPEDLPEARFSVHYRSLLEAGGDFYDVLPVSEGIFGYFVGDLSGHDIATGYMTSAVKALLAQNCIPIYQPHESMRMINNVLLEILSDGKFMTACYALLNRKSNQMTLVSAGHPPAIYHPKDGDPIPIKIAGDVLGAFKDVCFGVQKIRVSPGDRFYLYSDGLIETSHNKKSVWTHNLKNLQEVCVRLGKVPFKECAEVLVHRMMKHSPALEDDIVVLGVEV